MTFEPAIKLVISRAFYAAHLLTGSIQQAERAVLEAIDSFDPHHGNGETLFRNALQAAVQNAITPMLAADTKSSEAVGVCLPAELQAVLDLAPDLRRCFVLRALVGLSRRASALILRLSARRVDEYTCAALRCLAGFNSRKTAGSTRRSRGACRN